MEYGISKITNLNFDDAVVKVTNKLKKQGFGIITTIDVKKTLKSKLNIDYDNYIILGACNPQSAYQALQTEKEIGLLLPCNVIVYTQDNKVHISAIKPKVMMSVISNPNLLSLAEDIEERLINAINNV